MSTKTLITAADLEQLPDDDSVRIELDEGELITVPPAAMDHGDCASELARLLGNFVKRYDLGKIYAAETGFTLSTDTVRAPDVAFVRKQRLASVHRRGFGKGAPDLAVEVFSPSDSVRQLMRKVKQYMAAGCHTVWIVYPDRREIQILGADGTDRLLGAAGTLEAPELLPSFAVPVQAIFD